MAVFTYRKFKVSISEESKKTQGLKVGDIVRRQYYDGVNLIYTLMCVMNVGVDKVKVIENGVQVEKDRPWFVGALLEGDAPQTNELLDFVRVTNLWDANRLGAIYLTSSDAESPYIDVIDGIPVEQSLCYPTGINNVTWNDSFSQYVIMGKEYVNFAYQNSFLDNNRICSITRNTAVAPSGTFIGLSQAINKQLGNPDRVLISYKIKSSKVLNNIIASLEYEDGTRVDGTVSVASTTEWTYQLHVVTVDFSDRYKRLFKLNINDGLVDGDKVEIADFNIVLLSSVANFAGGLKIRIGKLNGLNDPVFGELENYGAYIQRLYATQQVNISGTLTAGDENGFGSTFYAGKIHKNVIINSVACDFQTATAIFPTEDNPTGVGEVYKSNTEMILNAQTNAWILGKLGGKYCFSFWAKNDTDCDVLISQNEHSIKTIHIIGDGSWRRYSVVFNIQEPIETNAPLRFHMLPSVGTLYFTAPQLEKGCYVTQYQPTDDVLSYVEDYGAWFNKGGIGGTIQNPLLKLNEDGSISSKNKSFVINNDGSGYFANGRFKWTQDEIRLQGVTIKWEDLDAHAQEELKPKSIKILGASSFVLNDKTYSPSQLVLELKETNFISSSSNRQWSFLKSDGNYQVFVGETGRTITILPDASYWNNSSTLTIKCTVTVNLVEYTDTITIQRIENGEDTYSVSLITTNGNTFKNGIGTTTIVAHVYKGGREITETLAPKDFDWIKTSSDPGSDAIFNSAHQGFGNQLTISSDDIWNMASFDCKVRIN